MRIPTKITIGLISVVVLVWGVNYTLVQRHMAHVLTQDSRNAGISMNAHYGYYLDPGTLVINLREVNSNNSPVDVFRVLLQFAASKKQSTFSRVVLEHDGNEKFLLEGAYFKQIGVEYGEQTPLYTARTFAENVYMLDGTPAFGTWTGGLLGVLSKQMEDFHDFHMRWYIEDIAKSDH